MQIKKTILITCLIGLGFVSGMIVEKRKFNEKKFAEFTANIKQEKTLTLSKIHFTKDFDSFYQNFKVQSWVQFNSGLEKEVLFSYFDKRINIGEEWSFHLGSPNGSWIILDELISKER